MTDPWVKRILDDAAALDDAESARLDPRGRFLARVERAAALVQAAVVDAEGVAPAELEVVLDRLYGDAVNVLGVVEMLRVDRIRSTRL